MSMKILNQKYDALNNTANPFPVMTTGISLCSNSHREFPVMNTGSLQWEQGFPVMKTGFSLWEFTTQGKPCSGPVLALYGIAVMPNYFVGNKLVLKINVLIFEYKYNGSWKKLDWVVFQVILILRATQSALNYKKKSYLYVTIRNDKKIEKIPTIATRWRSRLEKNCFLACNRALYRLQR